VILGLPIDIRHIAFSSANLGYVIIGSEVIPAWQTLAWASFGVLCIGLTNLAVSFTLALRTAFRARRLQFSGARVLMRAVWQRFRESPGSFFIPPKSS
jgi:site-specific recombinase